MVQQITSNAKAVKVSSNREGDPWFKCNLCGDMFRAMVHFEEWDFYYCIPRSCPNCCVSFQNGMQNLDE